MQRNGDILYTALNRSCCKYNHFMIESTNTVLEVRTMYAMDNCSHKARSRKKGRNSGDLRKFIFRLYPLDLKAVPQLAPAFGSRGGGGGGGFFEGTMGVCSASAWLNSSSSDEDGEADNGEPRGE
jgi:hypothetical protein